MFTELHHDSGAASHYRPPPHIAKQIIAHAIRGFHKADQEKILGHCYPRKQNLQQGLPPHVHDQGGQLQWAFLN